MSKKFAVLLTVGVILGISAAFFYTSGAYLKILPPKVKWAVFGASDFNQIRLDAKRIYDKCIGQTAGCYELGASDMVDRYPVADILSAVYDYDQYFSCHGFTHYIGRALYKKYGSVADSYSQIDFTCHGGTYHGIMEAYLQKRGGVDAISGEEIQKICSDSKTKTDKNPTQVFNECLHGMGHAFMFLTDSNLPKSLNYCDKINYKAFEETCYGGAFMENSTSSTSSDHPSQWLKADDRLYPCDILDSHQQNQCYLYQANYWLKDTGYNFAKVFSDCRALSGSLRDYCTLGIGTNLAGFSSSKSIVEAANVCGLPARDQDEICVEGAVSSLFSRYGGETQKIKEFCDLVVASLTERCFAKMGNLASAWGHPKEKVAEICRSAEKFEKACLGQTNITLKF